MSVLWGMMREKVAEKGGRGLPEVVLILVAAAAAPPDGQLGGVGLGVEVQRDSLELAGGGAEQLGVGVLPCLDISSDLVKGLVGSSHEELLASHLSARAVGVHADRLVEGSQEVIRGGDVEAHMLLSWRLDSARLPALDVPFIWMEEGLIEVAHGQRLEAVAGKQEISDAFHAVIQILLDTVVSGLETYANPAAEGDLEGSAVEVGVVAENDESMLGLLRGLGGRD